MDSWPHGVVPTLVIPNPDLAFADDQAADAGIEDLLQHFGLPEHVAWFDIKKLATTSLVQAVEQRGVAAVMEGMATALSAACKLAHGQAKP